VAICPICIYMRELICIIYSLVYVLAIYILGVPLCIRYGPEGSSRRVPNGSSAGPGKATFPICKPEGCALLFLKAIQYGRVTPEYGTQICTIAEAYSCVLCYMHNSSMLFGYMKI
jgi:hypothetical protein